MELLSGFWSTKIHNFCTNTAELVSSYRVPTTTMHWTEDNRQTGNTVYTEVHLKYTELAYTFGVEQCFFLTFHTTHMLLCCVCVLCLYMLIECVSGVCLPNTQSHEHCPQPWEISAHQPPLRWLFIPLSHPILISHSLHLVLFHPVFLCRRLSFHECHTVSQPV